MDKFKRLDLDSPGMVLIKARPSYETNFPGKKGSLSTYNGTFAIRPQILEFDRESDDPRLAHQSWPVSGPETGSSGVQVTETVPGQDEIRLFGYFFQF